MTRREDLHELVDRLPEDQFSRARFYLLVLNSPVDDEAVTDDDRAAIDEARTAQRDDGLVGWVPGYFR